LRKEIRYNDLQKPDKIKITAKILGKEKAEKKDKKE
jgi:hypothetical protein